MAVVDLFPYKKITNPEVLEKLGANMDLISEKDRTNYYCALLDPRDGEIVGDLDMTYGNRIEDLAEMTMGTLTNRYGPVPNFQIRVIQNSQLMREVLECNSDSLSKTLGLNRDEHRKLSSELADRIVQAI